jgi:hypothetical protein
MDIFKSLFTSHNLSLFEIIKHYVTKTNISQLLKKYRVKKEKDTREKRKQETKTKINLFLFDYPIKVYTNTNSRDQASQLHVFSVFVLHFLLSKEPFP